jgi:leucyl aminopeptidase
MEVIAQLKPNVNVIALAPLSENLPSGKATKPGDILKFYNGKTAEIKNTDAEGRLILADALSYAVKHYKPDAIIDIATLTGACAYALGPYFTGLMSEHDDLVAKIEAASKKVGDPVWRLPMTSDYKQAIKSEVADICNIGDGRIKAGAITAAHFLQHFVGSTPWAHLDIAGTAFDVPNIPYFRSGATGAGVRLLIGVVMNW